MQLECLVEGCSNPPKNIRGWCNGHYTRLIKHGDVRAHIPLANGPKTHEKFLKREVLNYKGRDCLFWPHPFKGSVPTMSWEGRKWVASRLVCVLVHGEPPTQEHQAAHECGNGHLGCVNPSHLSWKTHAENQADRLRHGTHNRGERQGRSKLTESQVRDIRERLGHETQTAIAAALGVSQSHIHGIKSGRFWGWLT